MTISRWRNPKIYGLLGFILVAAPTLLFFFVGMPYTRVSPTEIGSRESGVMETIWEGAFNPFFLYFVIGAAVAAWGYNRNTTLAWVGSFFVLALSIITLPSIGLITLPGAVLLVTGAALKTFNRGHIG
jgi:hypothetical protein